MARRKKSSRKRGASRGGASGKPAVTWFVAGLLCGLLVSGAIFFKMFFPGKDSVTPVESSVDSSADTEPLIPETTEENHGSRFDFFTVLPEMEVVVPDRALSEQATPTNPADDDARSGKFLLQAGSFQNTRDAEQLKAQLALLGTQANVQVVTVNDVTWHRVRIGPVQGARQADQLRRQLLDNGIETLVMRANP